MMAIRGIN